MHCTTRPPHLSPTPPAPPRGRSGTVLTQKRTFGCLVSHTAGAAATLVTRLSVILNSLGATVAYLIIIGDVLAGQPAEGEDGLLKPLEPLLGPAALQRWACLGAVVLTVHLPLCCLRRIELLSFTSLLSVALCAGLIAATLVVYSHHVVTRQLAPVNWLPDPAARPVDFIKALPVLSTAYVCTFNLGPIFSAMERPTEARMRGVVSASLGTCTAIYWLFAVAAYSLFGPRTQHDVLMNYGPDLGVPGSVWIERAIKTGFAVSLSCTLPLLQFSLRESLFSLLGHGPGGPPTALLFYGTTAVLLAR